MKQLILILAIVSLVLLAGCAQEISEIKNGGYLDKEVTVKGEVVNLIKLGELSGYSIQDKNEDTIFVSSDELPTEGSKVTAKGTLKKVALGFIQNYYIETE